MSERQEMVDDIIAEMLGARTEFPFVYLMGEPDTPEVIDPKTKKIIEPRKINIRRVTVKELACRLKAAHKRERGNSAALREACAKAAESAAEIMERVRHKDGLAFNTANYIAGVARTALAEPPRNCDVGTAEEQAKRLHRFCISQDCVTCPCNLGKADGRCEFAWMQTPYKEGGAK